MKGFCAGVLIPFACLYAQRPKRESWHKAHLLRNLSLTLYSWGSLLKLSDNSLAGWCPQEDGQGSLALAAPNRLLPMSQLVLFLTVYFHFCWVPVDNKYWLCSLLELKLLRALEFSLGHPAGVFCFSGLELSWNLRFWDSCPLVTVAIIRKWG